MISLTTIKPIYFGATALAHKHTHTVNDRETSGPVIDPNNNAAHWHTLGGNKTSSASQLGGSHTHTIDGDTTGPPIDRDEKGTGHKIEIKNMTGRITNTKEMVVDGVKVGIIEGYAATWDVDRGSWGVKDQFVKGAFANAIAFYQSTGRKLRFFLGHRSLIGGFPPDTMKEDNTGLFVVGHVNLDTEIGRDTFSFAKQKVLTEFSVGWEDIKSTTTDDQRTITEAWLWENSIVPEAMNPKAVVTQVKAIAKFRDLPIATKEREWNSDKAMARMRELTDSADSPSTSYKQAFVFYDEGNANSFESFKLPIADVIDGKLTVVPKAVFAAAEALLSDSGALDMPDQERKNAIRHIERYYAKMNIDSPFSADDKQYFTGGQVKLWTPRDFEQKLKKLGMFSNSALKILASRLDKPENSDQNEKDKGLLKLLNHIKGITNTLK